MKIKCRFGCDEADAVWNLPGGCFCFKDQVQALCGYHAYKCTALDGITKICDIRHKGEADENDDQNIPLTEGPVNMSGRKIIDGLGEAIFHARGDRSDVDHYGALVKLQKALES